MDPAWQLDATFVMWAVPRSFRLNCLKVIVIQQLLKMDPQAA